MLYTIDNWYMKQEEPAKSCLLALRQIILSFNNHITETWQYGMPFFYLRKKRLCYVWVDKKTARPYLGIVEGSGVSHPLLVAEKRKRMKILYVDPSKDIPLPILLDILRQAIA